MKIEMGESLFYSWLRHVKECQIVQTNWKPSPSWPLQDEDKLKQLMESTDRHYQNKYGYGIFKNNSLTQLLMQAEVDALGICMTVADIEVHAIDVAFHEAGLNYGDRQETVMRVVKKIIRTAMCLIGYFGVPKGDILFASPKIHNAIIADLEPCVEELNTLFQENGYGFIGRIIANDDFNNLILKPILISSDGVSDTSELFMRGYQLVKMFANEPVTRQRSEKSVSSRAVSNDTLSELKIGKIAQTLLREALESGKIDDVEIKLMQGEDYSKSTFGINYPLLVSDSGNGRPVHYYTNLLNIKGNRYYLCCEWYETAANDDRPYLLAWLEGHGALV